VKKHDRNSAEAEKGFSFSDSFAQTPAVFCGIIRKRIKWNMVFKGEKVP